MVEIQILIDSYLLIWCEKDTFKLGISLENYVTFSTAFHFNNGINWHWQVQWQIKEFKDRHFAWLNLATVYRNFVHTLFTIKITSKIIIYITPKAMLFQKRLGYKKWKAVRLFFSVYFTCVSEMKRGVWLVWLTSK